MSNSEPSAIMLQGIPCIGGLYKFRFEWRKHFAQDSPRVTPAKLTVFVEPVEGDLSILADLDEVAVGITHVAAPFPAVIV